MNGLAEKVEDSKAVYIILAVCYKKLGDIDGSLRVLQAALDKYPSHTDALFLRGKLLIKQKKYAEAL